MFSQLGNLHLYLETANLEESCLTPSDQRGTWCFLQGTEKMKDKAAPGQMISGSQPPPLCHLPIRTPSGCHFSFLPSTHQYHSALVGLFWCVCVPWRMIWVGKVDVHLTQKQKRKHSLLGAVREDISGGGKGWDEKQVEWMRPWMSSSSHCYCCFMSGVLSILNIVFT